MTTELKIKKTLVYNVTPKVLGALGVWFVPYWTLFFSVSFCPRLACVVSLEYDLCVCLILRPAGLVLIITNNIFPSGKRR